MWLDDVSAAPSAGERYEIENEYEALDATPWATEPVQAAMPLDSVSEDPRVVRVGVDSGAGAMALPRHSAHGHTIVVVFGSSATVSMDKG